MKAIRLRTEALQNPIGIDIARPRLSWNCEGGKKQTAYRVLAKGPDDRIENNFTRILWDSGKVVSNQMAYIPWGGQALSARDRVSWQVMLWDENDQAGEWSDKASFEISVFPEDWKAKWISGAYRPYPRTNQALQYVVKKHGRFPVDCFRKEVVTEKTVVKARLYASACGLYEVSIDGKKAGNFCLAPGITDYRKRVQLQTIDVTDDFSTPGNHEITGMLADGWYRGSVGAWGLLDQYGTQTKFICQLELTYDDGHRETIGTDATWQWSNDGPIRFADNKDGEKVDARMAPSYGGRAVEVSHPVLPTPSNNVPLTEHERFRPEISRTPSGKLLFDFGQNFAGYVEFSVQAEEGQALLLRMGEMLDTDGELTLDNIQCRMKDRVTPLQEIRYITKAGENYYKTRFAIFGFQYVEMSGNEDLLAAFESGKARLTGIAVYSDLEQTGTFESSNDLLNRFVEATVWSTKSNSADLPTDCPTRERHGWTGDAQIFFNSASYLFDYRTFARKYLNDMYDWQKKDGCLPEIVPDGGADFFMATMNGSSGWADAGIQIPYRFEKIFGDEDILRQYYGGMCRFARFMERRCGKTSVFAKKIHLQGPGKKYLVNTGASYGEWAEPADVFVNQWTEQVVPHPEVSTAYASYVFSLMAEIAERLEKKEDAAEFRSYADGCREAYQELVETEGFSLDTDRQACLVRPLYFNLLNAKQTEFAKKRLLKAMENYRWRLGTGFLSTPFILDVLLEIDPEAAYRLLENEEIPGWLSMPRQGATTIWESWEGPDSAGTGIGSLNHYSKGALVEWLFAKMCGIRVDGENHFRIEPHPGGHFTFAEAVYTSVYGRVLSGWKKKDGKYTYTIEIPANTCATLVLGGKEQELSAGSYEF